jgi:hypothetical protein
MLAPGFALIAEISRSSHWSGPLARARYRASDALWPASEVRNPPIAASARADSCGEARNFGERPGVIIAAANAAVSLVRKVETTESGNMESLPLSTC